MQLASQGDEVRGQGLRLTGEVDGVRSSAGRGSGRCLSPHASVVRRRYPRRAIASLMMTQRVDSVRTGEYRTACWRVRVPPWSRGCARPSRGTPGGPMVCDEMSPFFSQPLDLVREQAGALRGL